jgi:hypothetical protein
VADKGTPKDVYLPEVLIEYRRVGKMLRVIAIDPITRIEVIMITPLDATKNEIKRNAARKLAYVIAKKKQAGDGEL